MKPAAPPSARRDTGREAVRVGRGNPGGYILFEALIALTVLSVSVYVVQQGLREAIIARGHARDYTQARLLMEELVNELQVQPLFKEESRSGRFKGDQSRFSWRYTISKVEVPVPPPPPPRPQAPGPQPPVELALPVDFLGKIEATIRWTRSGLEFQESAQTLFSPERLWLPPPPPPPPPADPNQPRTPR